MKDVSDLRSLDIDQLKRLKRQIGDVGKAEIDRVIAEKQRAREAAPDPDHVFLVVPWGVVASKNVLRSSVYEYAGAIQAIRSKIRDQVEPRPAFPEGECRVLLAYYPPNRRWDPHNIDPAIFDALEGVAYTNDRQVTSWRGVAESTDERHPRVEVHVERAET